MTTNRRSVPSQASTVDRYLAEANRHPVLTRHEERELAIAYRDTGDPALAQRLARANLRFVVKVAREFRGDSLELGDLIQEGNVGLLMAVERFDPDRGYRLLSYAVWWIRAYIMSFVMRTWSLVKIGTTATQRKLFFKMRSTRQRVEARQGAGTEGSANGELSSLLGVDRDDLAMMESRLAGRDFSLDAQPARSGGETFLDQLPEPSESPGEVVERAELGHRVRQWIRSAEPQLDEREQMILRERLHSHELLTLREVGERFAISRERARQIQERAKTKLRALAPDDLRAGL